MKNLASALAKCQGELKDVFKGSKGYGYSYAPLDEVLKQIRPIASKYGLSFVQSQSFNDDIISVTTILLHESGETLETTSQSPFARLKGMNDYQSIGSGITYLRRYNLSATFGIASDEDQDAHGEQEVRKNPPPSKTSEKEMAETKKEFVKQASEITSIDFNKEKEALGFMLDSLSVPKDGDEKKQYAVIRKWLNSPENFENQLSIFVSQYDEYLANKE